MFYSQLDAGICAVPCDSLLEADFLNPTSSGGVFM